MSSSELVQIGRRSLERTLVPESEAQSAPVPRFGHLYVTHRCHHACEHCYESEASHPRAGELSFAEIEVVLDEMAALGVLVLTLSGGEPFLRKDLMAIVAAARARRFAVKLYTAGTHIDDDRARRLAELRVSEVQVSLHAATPSLHDDFTRRPGSHARAMRGLRLLREHQVPAFVKTSAMTFNQGELDALADLAAELGAGFILGDSVVPRVDGDRSPHRFLLSEEELAAQILAQPRLRDALDARGATAVCTGEGVWSADSALCGAARNVVTVDAQGRLLACSSFPESAGSVREAPLGELWRRSPGLRRVRATRFSDMKHCSTCEDRGGCNPCMAYALVEHGDRLACSSTARHVARATRRAARLHAQDPARTATRAAHGRTDPRPLVLA
jgi:radical SAM protein with 4Fe4S-binding SPASM domain